MALVRVREGTGRHERSLVGSTVALPGLDSAARALQLALRCRRQVSHHIGSGLHQVLRRNRAPVSNLRRAVPGGKSRRTITHMRLLSVSRGGPGIKVRMDRLFHFTSCLHRKIDGWKMFNSCPAEDNFEHFHFSDFMQKGASLPASQLIKVITRGRTSRLSADPLLEFFRPLDAWLEAQNRDESVSIATSPFIEINKQNNLSTQIIGWSSNMDDVQLFQNLALNKATAEASLSFVYIISLTAFMNFM